MAETSNIFEVQILLRADSAENWSSKNPILGKNELGIELGATPSEHKYKLGDGVTAWNELDYTLTMPSGTKVHQVTDLESIEAPANGEFAIVSTAIGETGVNTYTAYIYDANTDPAKWVALTGNYNAKNVYFDSDFVVTQAIGTITDSDISAGNGSAPLDAEGKNLQEVLASLFAEAKNPVVTQPSASISVSGGTNEVGQTFSLPTATLRIDSIGSYSYGGKDDSQTYTSEQTGVVFDIGNVTLTQAGAEPANSTSNDSALQKNGTITLVAQGENTTYGDSPISITFNGSASYTPSATIQPVNNLGTKMPELAIGHGQSSPVAISVASKTATFTGYRKPFWGYKSTAEALSDPTTITSAQIRALQNSGTSVGGVPTSYTVPADTKQVFFAIKAGTKNSLSVINTSALGAPVAVTKVASGVQVEGANAYTATAYDLWYINLDQAFSGQAVLGLTWK